MMLDYQCRVMSVPQALPQKSDSSGNTAMLLLSLTPFLVFNNICDGLIQHILVQA